MCRYVIKLLLSNSIILHGCFFLIFSPKMLTLNMTFMLVMVIILHLNSEQCSGQEGSGSRMNNERLRWLRDGRYSCKSCKAGFVGGPCPYGKYSCKSPYVCWDCVLGSAVKDANFSCGRCRIGDQSPQFYCRRCRNNGPEIGENNLDMYGNACQKLGERLAERWGTTCKNLENSTLGWCGKWPGQDFFSTLFFDGFP